MRQVTFNCKCYPFVVFPTFVFETAVTQSPQQPSLVQGRVKRWKCPRAKWVCEMWRVLKEPEVQLYQCPSLILQLLSVVFSLLTARLSQDSAHRLWMLSVSRQDQTSTPSDFRPQWQNCLLSNSHLVVVAVQSCKIFVTKEMLLLSISIGYTGGWKHHHTCWGLCWVLRSHTLLSVVDQVWSSPSTVGCTGRVSEPWPALAKMQRVSSASLGFASASARS